MICENKTESDESIFDNYCPLFLVSLSELFRSHMFGFITEFVLPKRFPILPKSEAIMVSCDAMIVLNQITEALRLNLNKNTKKFASEKRAQKIGNSI